MKKLISIVSLSLMLLFSGCVVSCKSVNDRNVVAPDNISSEVSSDSDPVLPTPHVWWK